MTNYSRIVVKRHEWTAEGITRAHTFAFASDLHAGDPQSMKRLREFCRQVNAANPEFVVLGGDITDELTTYDEMVMTYSVLAEIEAPVYFVYGNHDRQPSSSYCGGRTYSDEQLAVEESALQVSGHTHAGQLWPLQTFYRMLGYRAYGEFEEPGTLLYVSAGEGVWMLPLRLEEHSEW